MKPQDLEDLNAPTRRCECVWCRQVFYSMEYYKYGTCSSCLLSKVVTPLPRLAEILREAEREARKELENAKKQQ